MVTQGRITVNGRTRIKFTASPPTGGFVPPTPEKAVEQHWVNMV